MSLQDICLATTLTGIWTSMIMKVLMLSSFSSYLLCLAKRVLGIFHRSALHNDVLSTVVGYAWQTNGY